MDISISITRFSLTRDMHSKLKEWLKYYQMEDGQIDSLPKLGLMVSHFKAPIAVGFLREVEGHKAILDGLIADPKTAREIKDECIDQLVIALLKLAKEERFTGILAFTTNKRILMRAKKLGFALKPHRLVCFDLHA